MTKNESIDEVIAKIKQLEGIMFFKWSKSKILSKLEEMIEFLEGLKDAPKEEK